MTHRIANRNSHTARDRREWLLYSLEVEAELEQLDRVAGHDYLPMDVFIDSGTLKRHFRDSSVRNRRLRLQRKAR
ncbi:MAG: hypothetical protein KDI74_18270 [Gammaproteobacteria bacterium]|nr:hypothetical protein [Gammaproteobacteria bacterium]